MDLGLELYDYELYNYPYVCPETWIEGIPRYILLIALSGIRFHDLFTTLWIPVFWEEERTFGCAYHIVTSTLEWKIWEEVEKKNVIGVTQHMTIKAYYLSYPLLC